MCSNYPIFDPKRFGELVRQERRKAGFSNTARLSDGIREATGVFIDKDTLIRIERGERLPDVQKFFAIAYTLGGSRWESFACDFLEGSIDGIAALREVESDLRECASILNELDVIALHNANGQPLSEYEIADWMYNEGISFYIPGTCKWKLARAVKKLNAVDPAPEYRMKLQSLIETANELSKHIESLRELDP